MSCLNELKGQGLKLTPQRRLISDIIHDADAHITAEQIIAKVQSKMPGVNKTTIYRTLEILEEAGCVFRGRSGNTSIYHRAEKGHHHHLVCRKCGKTVNCDESLFLGLEKSVARDYGFQIDFKHMVISGLCKTCSNQS